MNAIEFTGCREYHSESFIHFEGVAPEPKGKLKHAPPAPGFR